jgi:hypothetical protein
LSAGETLNLTVLPAFTLTGSPVRGLSALRAFVLATRKVPKPGREAARGFQLFDDGIYEVTSRSIRRDTSQLSRVLQNGGNEAF